MARHTTNKEGLTWEEWVCAAGHARFDYGWDPNSLVRPYSESHTSSVPIPGTAQLINGFIESRRELKRITNINYPVKLRKAWLNGEDPTEYRG